jgi:hypothetical protein
MTSPSESRELFGQLQPGDRVEVEHRVTVGRRQWTARTAGTVVRTERARHGLHHRRNFDDKVFSDVLVLRRDDGELNWVTLDEFTTLRRSPPAETAGHRG